MQEKFYFFPHYNVRVQMQKAIGLKIVTSSSNWHLLKVSFGKGLRI